MKALIFNKYALGSSVFAAVRDELFSEEQFLELQWQLCRRPEAGEVIPETGGCRKMRWKVNAHGVS